MTEQLNDRSRRNRLAVLGASLLAGGCTSSLEVEIRLVDPCDQNAVTAVDFIRIEPRGTGLDSTQLTTIERVDAFETAPIDVPLVEDFTLVASGHRSSFDAPAAAIGVSSTIDLTQADDKVTLAVPFSLLGQFYRTTNLDAPREAQDRCSSLRQDRFGATATVLPGGQVLVVGGARYSADGFLEFPRLVEVYDPARGVFMDGPTGSNRKWELGSGQPRRHHTADLLPDGRVLVAGGQAPDPMIQGSEIALRSAFIVDARDIEALEISQGGIAMQQARTGHRSVVLADGRVVMVGGRSLNPNDTRVEAQIYLDSVEIYEPSAGAFLLATDELGNAVRLSEGRYGHSAQPIPATSDVLVAGGLNRQGPVTTVEVLRLARSGAFVTTTQALGIGAIDHAAAVTQDGTVLLSGGYTTVNDVRTLTPRNSVALVEVWAVDAVSGVPQRICTGNLIGERGRHTSSVVARRAIFVGGRQVDGTPRSDGEVVELLPLNEALARQVCFAQSPALQPMHDARSDHASVLLPSSREVLVIGGVKADPGPSTPGQSISVSEVFSDFARRGLLTTPGL